MNHAPRLRIVYAGTPDFSVPPLLQLIEAGFPPVAVLTQPDRPAGRGKLLSASPVKQAAAAAAIPIHQPTMLRGSAAYDLIAGLKPDLVIVVAYGLILPANILQLPRHGCWNIHASLLPRWRGAAPIQRAIEAGDRESGVCIMQMDEGLDTGAIIDRVPVVLGADETGGSLHERLSELGAARLLDCVRRLACGVPLESQPQPESGVSYAKKLDKAEAGIDWSQPAQVLERRIRAFNPWPVVWCMVGPERTRIWQACTTGENSGHPPGTILAAGRQGIDIATGKQVLRLLELQRPGKRRMSAVEYLNAMSLPKKLENGR